jgi:membrane associated rhomboid family serine protease
MFGGQLERFWGTKEFLKYYFLTGIGAGVSTAVINHHSAIPTIGASGAIYGLLLAYGVLFPNAIIYLWFLLPIKAKYFVIVFGVLEFLASVSPRGDMVAHLAHLGGMIIGLVYLKRKDVTHFIARNLKEFSAQREYKKRRRLFEEEEKVKREVDELLDKINVIGFDNLSKGEKQRLDQASKFLRERAKR